MLAQYLPSIVSFLGLTLVGLLTWLGKHIWDKTNALEKDRLKTETFEKKTAEWNQKIKTLEDALSLKLDVAVYHRDHELDLNARARQGESLIQIINTSMQGLEQRLSMIQQQQTQQKSDTMAHIQRIEAASSENKNIILAHIDGLVTALTGSRPSPNDTGGPRDRSRRRS